MTFNSLLMFDIVFVFFLFLVGVTCLVYYLPPSKHINSANHLRHNYKLVANGSSGDDSNCMVAHHQHHQQQQPLQQEQQQRHQHHFYQNHRYHDDENYQIDELFDQPTEIDSHDQKHHHHHHHYHQLHPHTGHECMRNHSQHKTHEFSANNMKLSSSNYDERSVDLGVKYDVIDEKSSSILLATSTFELLPPPPPAPAITVPSHRTTVTAPSFCYIKAKYREIKNSTGPIQSV